MTAVQDASPGSRPADPLSAPARRGVAGYLAAVAAVAAACGLCAVLGPWIAPNFLMVFLLAVVVAAWHGGLGPGLAASALAVLAVNFLFMPPVFRLAVRGPGDAVKLAFLAAAGYLASVLSQRLIHARDRAARAADEAERMSAQLQDQAVELETGAEELQALNAELAQQVEEAEALRHGIEAANTRLLAAGEEARRAGDRLRRILETMAEGVLLIAPDGRITFANDAAARILAVPGDELVTLGRGDPRLAPLRGGAPLPPDQTPAGRALRTGERVVGEEVELPRGAGRVLLRVSAAPLHEPGGGEGGVVLTLDDVTAERGAVQALRESESRFRAMADSAPVLVWTAGPDGLCTWFNRPWLEFTGRAIEQELGNGWAEGVHPDDYQRCLTLFYSGVEARREFRMEYRLRRHDGEYRWVMDHGVPLVTPAGTFTGYIGSCVDITELREGQDQQRFLADAGTVLSSSLDYTETLRRVARLAVPVMADVCVIDVLDEGRIQRVDAVNADPAQDAAVRRLVAWTPDPSSADPVAVVMRTAHPLVVNDGAAAAGAARLEPAEAVRELGVSAYMAVPLVARGRVLGSILLCATTSGRRYDHAELVRAEELARRAAFAIDNARLYERAVEANRAKNDFLAVMSHELRTPLNAILGYTDLFLMGIPAPLPAPVEPQVQRVQSAARHLLELIEEILTFARIEAGQEEVRPAPVAVSALVQEAAALVEPLALERGIGFVVRGPEPDFTLVADPRKVRQVLINLLGNAIKFTERGRAVLEARREGGHAVFVVSDTGVGIFPDQLERIFEPFWQAEQGLIREHGGSGLGLSVARQLARLMGGDVTVKSTRGEGSEFTFRVPVGTGEVLSAEC
ncbi:MAG TPA: ATP-binding protein [Longimicrobium sp.]|jgi:PAS domain S-box-containing protein